MITRDAYEYFKNEPDILRVSDITRLLHCSKNTVYELVKDGKWTLCKWNVTVEM